MIKIPFEEVEAAILESSYMGWCLACGEEAYNVEPDARNYTCESCGDVMVFGAEQIVIEFPEVLE